MTSASDIPNQSPALIELKLPTASDLSYTSFEEAYKLLREAGDNARILTCSHETMLALGKDFIAWLWDNHRGVSFWTVPASLLATSNAWCLCGYTYAVVDKGA